MNGDDSYDDLMNDLERGEINFYKPEITTNFFGRKIKRNISESSIVSSEKSSESITPEPNECFNWELNEDEIVKNSYNVDVNVDDALLESAYRNYNVKESFGRGMPSNNKLFSNYESTLQTQTHAQRKQRALYHRMSQFNSDKKNETPLENSNTLVGSSSRINPYSNSNYNSTYNSYNSSNHDYETRLNIN